MILGYSNEPQQNNNIFVSDLLRQFAQDNTPALLFGAWENEKKVFKRSHIENVMRIGMEFATTGINRELLQLCLQLHDIGRRKQFELLNNFDDNKLDHHSLALQYISEWLKAHATQTEPLTTDWSVVLDCCLYHGNDAFDTLAHDYSRPYLTIVRAADQIENGCIGALGYLEHEKKYDVKGYIAANPLGDQTACNRDLFQYLSSGRMFSKAALCHTYAEYFIYAATLAVHSYNKYPEIAARYINQHNTVEKYCHIFETHLKPEDAKLASQILRQACTKFQIIDF